MILTKVHTEDIDRGRLKILKDLKDINKSFITIGIHRDAKPYQNGVRVQDVAWWSEFGTPTQPERSFLRSTFDRFRPEWRKLTKKLYGDIVFNRIPVRVAMAKLGLVMTNEVRNTIETLKLPVNAPRTIRGKPLIGDNPLIHTRKMKRDVKFKIHLRAGSIG